MTTRSRPPITTIVYTVRVIYIAIKWDAEIVRNSVDNLAITLLASRMHGGFFLLAPVGARGPYEFGRFRFESILQIS